MKKSFIISALIASMGLFLGSCSNELEQPSTGDGSVTITATLPNTINSRAFSTGASATKLHYAVYEAGTTNVIFASDKTGSPEAAYNNDLTFSLSLNLVKGQTYDFIFWADNNDNAVYQFSSANQNVTITYGTTANSNKDERDAFFSAEKGVLVTGAMQKNIKLYRPFAQLNVGTNDVEVARKAGITHKSTAVTVKNVFTKLSLIDGVASEPADVTYDYVEPTSETFPVSVAEGETAYTYLSMNYLLTGDTPLSDDVNNAQKETKDVTITFKDDNDEVINKTGVSVSAVPFQRNYRTNIYGALLTSPLDWTIEIVPDFNKEDYSEEVTFVSTLSDLQNAVKEGGTIALSKPMNIKDLELPSDKPVTIDLNGNNANFTKSIPVKQGQELNIKGNGSEVLGVANVNGLLVNSGKASIENVQLVDNFNHTKYPNHLVSMVIMYDPDSEVSLKDVTIIPKHPNTYAITTNAEVADLNIKVTMENVKVLPTAVIACPVLFNLPMTVTAKDCVFEGCNQAIVLRGGTYTFENCTFTQTLAFDENGIITTKDDIKNKFRSKFREKWESGTGVPLAAITMGNKGKEGDTGYQYPTVVNLKGCTVNIPEVAKNTGELESSLPAVYIAANAAAENGVKFTYDAATTIDGAIEYDTTNKANISINGKVVE